LPLRPHCRLTRTHRISEGRGAAGQAAHRSSLAAHHPPLTAGAGAHPIEQRGSAHDRLALRSQIGWPACATPTALNAAQRGRRTSHSRTNAPSSPMHSCSQDVRQTRKRSPDRGALSAQGGRIAHRRLRAAEEGERRSAGIEPQACGSTACAPRGYRLAAVSPGLARRGGSILSGR
jgi:hypothetical protein